MSKRIAIFVSGGGSNARVMIDRFRAHPEDGVEPVLLVSNKASAGGLTVAAERGVPSLVVKRSDWVSGEELLRALEAYEVDLIVLAGFLWLIPSYLVQAYPKRIVNIHPALLPRYGGKGMYGKHVHAAVKEAGETESGITIHYVNENYDEGSIIYQAADNHFLEQSLMALYPLSLRMWNVALAKLGDKKENVVEYEHIVEHQQIMDALQNGAVEESVNLMRRHIEAYQQYIENVILGKSAQLHAA